MSFWLIREAGVLLERLSHLCKDVNPLHSVLLLFVHFILAFFVAALTPVVIRKVALPSSIRNEIELNLSFDTCSAELHGICSFPSAVVEYEKGALFSPSVIYDLSIRLRFADTERQQKLEVFQNIVSLYDRDELLKTFSKSSYFKKPSLLIMLLWTAFFPLYYTGLFYDYNTLVIPLTPCYSESITQSSTKLFYQLQDRFAQVESATLIVDARFGIIRHLLYNWPLITYAVLFVSSFSACCLIVFLYWWKKSLMVLSKSSGEETESLTVPGSLDKTSTINNISSGPKVPLSVNTEEYIPDNVDEVPCCSDFTGFPGWEVHPLLENL